MTPGSLEMFRLRATKRNEIGLVVAASEYTKPLEVMTLESSINGDECGFVPPGPFNFPIELIGIPVDEMTLEGQPESVSLQGDPPRLAGEITPGSYAMSLSWSDGTGRHARNLGISLLVTEPPVVTTPVGNLTAVPDSPTVFIDLNDAFSDPDTETTVRMETVLGNIDVALTDSATPLTVANFLNYVDRGDWDGTFFHRSVSNFIIQGGGFKPGPDEKIDQIKQDDPVPNEYDPSRSNICGTIAMAKLSGDPNSATNQWFFNFSDNSANLDNQNGGFTTFGRVMGRGMQVVNAIAALPRRDFNVVVRTCEGEPPNETYTDFDARFEVWPLLRIRDEGLDTEDLVTVFKVKRISPMSFEVLSNSSPDVAAVTIEDQLLKVDYLAGGSTTVTVSATDLDGASIRHTFTVTVGEDYDFWAATNGLEGANRERSANPDRDAAINFAEYVFGGNPLSQDSIKTSPIPKLIGQNRDRPAITFRYRAHATDIEYIVEMSGDLRNWNRIWKSSSGLGTPSIVSTEDAGNGVRLITVAAPEDTPLPVFLHIQTQSR